MCPTVGIPCQRFEFERLAPTLPNNLCEKIGDSDALQIMDTKPQPSSAPGRTIRQCKYAAPKTKRLCGKFAIVTPFILRTLGCEHDCRCALTYTKPLTDGMSACVRYPLCSDTFRCKDSFCLCCYLGAPLEWKPRQMVSTSHTSATGLSTIWVIATSDRTDMYGGEYLGVM